MPQDKKTKSSETESDEPAQTASKGSYFKPEDIKTIYQLLASVVLIVGVISVPFSTMAGNSWVSTILIVLAFGVLIAIVVGIFLFSYIVWKKKAGISGPILPQGSGVLFAVLGVIIGVIITISIFYYFGYFPIGTRMNLVPVPSFTATPYCGAAPLPVYFTAFSKPSSDNWTWTIENGPPHSTTEPWFNFTFPSPGDYTVTLTSTNSAGMSDKPFSTKIHVTDHQASPIASFKMNPAYDLAVANYTVDFTNDYPESAKISIWDFGDGEPSLKVNPSYTYSKAGNYVVTLTVVNDYGMNISSPRTIRVVSKDDYARLYQQFFDNWFPDDNTSQSFVKMKISGTEEGKIAVNLLQNPVSNQTLCNWDNVSAYPPNIRGSTLEVDSGFDYLLINYVNDKQLEVRQHCNNVSSTHTFKRR
jgi:PKD repeat protein